MIEKLEAIVKARTPGVWAAIDGKVDSREREIAHCWAGIFGGKNQPQADANARFIAAMGTLADLMLDVVKAAHCVEGYGRNTVDYGPWKALEDALTALRSAVADLPEVKP